MNSVLLYEGEEKIKHLFHGKNYGSIVRFYTLWREDQPFFWRVTGVKIDCTGMVSCTRQSLLRTLMANLRDTVHQSRNVDCNNIGPNGELSHWNYFNFIKFFIRLFTCWTHQQGGQVKSQHEYKYRQQEVLARTNRLLSLIRHGPH
jgi:hypothetical protein